MLARMWGKRTIVAIDRNVNCTATMGNRINIFKKLKIKLPSDLALPLLDIIIQKKQHLYVEEITIPP